VVVDDGDHSVLLAGDASYTQELMLRGIVDGVSPSDAVARLTHERIRAFAASTPLVYAVAHDPDTGARIAHRQIIAQEQLEAIAA
jgi:glyoxylase-like metal-dependent hydrolase (beta-lactamase superfamily II)